MNYICHVLTNVCIYAILGVTLNLAMGYTGMLSLCHSAFCGIGAYTSVLLMVKAGVPFFPSLVAGVIAAGLVAYLVSIPAIRCRGDFFVLTTISVQMIVFSILYNWTSLTNGADGVAGVRRPSILGWQASSESGFFALVLLLATAVWASIWVLTNAPYGRALQAVRDDELAASALGKDVAEFRRSAFTIAGALAALAGGLAAVFAGYVDPTSFTLDESVLVLCVVVIGGAGTPHGPVLGAVVLVLLPEFLRFLPTSIAASAANFRQIAFGILLILFMRFRPTGIAGRYSFE